MSTNSNAFAVSASIVTSAIVAALISMTPAAAQPAGPGAGPGSAGAREPWFGPGMMMGPGMMGRSSYGFMCDPRAAGLGTWRIERVERIVRPTETQRAAFDSLKSASTKAVDALRASCPTDVALTPIARLDAMEKRLEAMLQVVKTVRPALADFYNSLGEDQKARFNGIGSEARRGWGWRWRWGQ